MNRVRTIGMNLKIAETEFIEDNSHCHLCSADMAGPCAYPFRVWMACAAAMDKSDKSDPNSTPQLSHKECQGALNKYVFSLKKLHVSFLFLFLCLFLFLSNIVFNLKKQEISLNF